MGYIWEWNQQPDQPSQPTPPPFPRDCQNPSQQPKATSSWKLRLSGGLGITSPRCNSIMLCTRYRVHGLHTVGTCGR